MKWIMIYLSEIWLHSYPVITNVYHTCSVSWHALQFTARASRDVNFIDMAESDSLLWGRRIWAFVGRTDGQHDTMQAHQEKDPPQSVSHGCTETR